MLFAKEGAELVISYRSDKKGAEEIIDCLCLTEKERHILSQTIYFSENTAKAKGFLNGELALRWDF